MANILVIDDDESLVRAIRLNLSLDGFRVQTARDGVEGLEKIAARGGNRLLRGGSPLPSRARASAADNSSRSLPKSFDAMWSAGRVALS